MRWQLILVTSSLLVSCGTLTRPSYRASGEGYRNQGQRAGSTDQSFTRSRPPKASRGPFSLTWPVKTVKVTRGFIKARRPHQGIDFDGDRNDPILAAHEGHVIYTGNGFSGYGNMIIVSYNDRWATLYAHLRKVSVSEGDYVRKGQLIGKMGRTGRATGTHLHFELMRNKIPIDPMPMLNKQNRLVKR